MYQGITHSMCSSRPYHTDSERVVSCVEDVQRFGVKFDPQMKLVFFSPVENRFGPFNRNKS